MSSFKIMFVLLAAFFGLMAGDMHGAFWPLREAASACVSDEDVRMDSLGVRSGACVMARPVCSLGTLADPRVPERVGPPLVRLCVMTPTCIPEVKNLRSRLAPSRVGQIVLLI